MNYTVLGISVSILLSSCSTFGMARKCPCEDIILPPRPIVENCISNGDGTCTYCNDYGCAKVDSLNKVCRDARQDAEVFNWIDYVTEAVKP